MFCCVTFNPPTNQPTNPPTHKPSGHPPVHSRRPLHFPYCNQNVKMRVSGTLAHVSERVRVRARPRPSASMWLLHIPDCRLWGSRAPMPLHGWLVGWLIDWLGANPKMKPLKCHQTNKQNNEPTNQAMPQEPTKPTTPSKPSKPNRTKQSICAQMCARSLFSGLTEVFLAT